MLKSHYVAAHSKLQLVRALLKNSLFRNIKQKIVKKCPPEVVSFEGITPSYIKTEILYLEDGFQNLDSNLENTDQNYSIFEENENKKHVKTSSLFENNFNFVLKDMLEPSVDETVLKIEQNMDTSNFSDSHDSSDADDKTVIKSTIEDITERKQRLTKLRNFRFDKTKRIINTKSLNEVTGDYYICHCMETQKNNTIVPVYQKNDLQNLISDTESCSDTGKNYFMPLVDHKLYCYTCGNGYPSKRKLLEHFKTHETKCNICEKTFCSVNTYKLHLKKHLLKMYVCHLCEAEFSNKDMLLDHLDAHIEDDIYENVFRLEQDYKIENNVNHLYYTDCSMFYSQYGL